MSYIATAIIGSAVIGAAGSVASGRSAARASDRASQAAQDTAAADRTAAVTLMEPQRRLGYGAMGDLSLLYGYPMAEYPTIQQVLRGGYSGAPRNMENVPSGPFGMNRGFAQVGDQLQGKLVTDAQNRITSGAGGTAPAGAAPGGGELTFGTQVTVPAGNGYYWGDATRATLYGPDGKVVWRAGLGMPLPAGVSTNQPTGGAPPGGFAGGGAAGGAGNFSRFFTSPDYTWRVSEGMKTLENSAAARGRLFSGATGKAITDWGQRAASQEYGDYFNRLLALSGMGQAATSGASQAVLGTGARIGDAQLAGGAGRASAYSNMYQGVANAANQGLQNWMIWKTLGGTGA